MNDEAPPVAAEARGTRALVGVGEVEHLLLLLDVAVVVVVVVARAAAGLWELGVEQVLDVGDVEEARLRT